MSNIMVFFLTGTFFSVLWLINSLYEARTQLQKRKQRIADRQNDVIVQAMRRYNTAVDAYGWQNDPKFDIDAYQKGSGDYYA